jgi:hypothetical protein
MAAEDFTTPSAFADTHTTANLNSIGAYNSIAGSALNNSVNLAMFADVSLQLASLTPTNESGVALYLYPRNKDNSTYGDNRFTTVAFGEPPPQYRVGAFQISLGAAAKWGTICGIVLPPGFFKFVLYNQGVAFAASGNTCQYRTYNRAVA